MNKLEVILNGIDQIKNLIKEKGEYFNDINSIIKVEPNDELSSLALKIGHILRKAEKCLILLQERARACQSSKALEIMQEKGIKRSHKVMTRVKNSLNSEILKSRDVTKDQIAEGSKDKIGHVDRKRTGQRRTREQIVLIWQEKIKVNRLNPAVHNRESLCLACGLSKSEVDNLGRAERQVILEIITGIKNK